MKKNIFIIVFVVFVATCLVIGAMLAGAKYHGDIIDAYRNVAVKIGLKKQADKGSPGQERVRLLDRMNNEKPYSHLNEITRINIREQQSYLEKIKTKYKDNIPLPEMINIPAGSFEMGCRRNNCTAMELPLKKVEVPSFEIAATELTFEQWDACVADGGCDIMPYDFGWGRGDRPVLNISWDDAQRYIKWLNEKTEGGYRLPSESEWEYAARAGQYEHDFPWDVNQYPNCNPGVPNAARFGVAAHFKNDIGECDYFGTAPVGSYAPNAWGLYDVVGNVAEFTQDCAGNFDLSLTPIDGSAYEDKTCFRRVVKGGAWTSKSGIMLVTTRRLYYRWHTFDRVGFRLARDIPSQSN